MVWLALMASALVVPLPSRLPLLSVTIQFVPAPILPLPLLVTMKVKTPLTQEPLADRLDLLHVAVKVGVIVPVAVLVGVLVGV